MNSSPRSLTAQLTIIGMIILVLIGVFIAATYWFTDRIEGEATRINDAGRLRYRSFEIATLLHEYLDAGPGGRSALKASIDERMAAVSVKLGYLRTGSLKSEYAPLSDEKASSILADVAATWDGTIKPSVSHVLSGDRTTESSAGFNERIRTFVGLVDRFVDALDAKNREDVSAFSTFRAFSFVFFFTVFVTTLYVVRKQVVVPLRRLRLAIATVEQGDLSTRVPIPDKNDRRELTGLARTFNDMVGAIDAQSAQAKALMGELEVKNRELNETNNALRSSKEQLEVAYEEAQTQSEELESGNEELRILNEDLDRKTKDILDVNRRLREEEELSRLTMAELRTIFDGIGDAIAFFDTDFHLVRANKAFQERFRIRGNAPNNIKCHAQLMGRNTVCERCLVAETCVSERPAFRETRTREDRILQTHTFPIRNQDRLVGVVEYIKDVTDQRMLEQQLIQAEKLTSLGEMISGVAHELNNPLTVIVGFSELLMRQPISSSLEGTIAKIHKESIRSKKIIDNILRFARRHPHERIVSDLNALLRQIVEIREYDLKTSNIETVAELDPRLPQIAVDPHQMQQVFLNIINNAQQAILDAKKRGRIVIATSLAEGAVKISFTDNGPGIALEHVGRIFDPFFTTKEVGKGTGLGLSISYTIVKEHGGLISVSSTLGEGTTFVISLPIGGKESPKRETDRHIQANNLASSRPRRETPASILAIDDEPMILELLKKILELDGHAVETASNAVGALAMLDAKRYDLIISDIRMPDMSGYAFVDAICKRDPDIVNRVLLMSGDIFHVGKSDGSEIPHVAKPFTIQTLKAAVAGILGQT